MEIIGIGAAIRSGMRAKVASSGVSPATSVNQISTNGVYAKAQISIASSADMASANLATFLVASAPIPSIATVAS
jgi:hypothetical protein